MRDHDRRHAYRIRAEGVVVLLTTAAFCGILDGTMAILNTLASIVGNNAGIARFDQPGTDPGTRHSRNGRSQ